MKKLRSSLLSPNFMCIGSQKAGTSWLYEMLKQHPDVWLPKIKEVHYFDYLFGEDTNTFKWGPGHVKKAMKRIESEADNEKEREYAKRLLAEKCFTFDWYCSIFDHEDALNKKIVGEITPEYCSISEVGILAIKGMLDGGKVIWIVRDPYERVVSQIKMSANRMLEEKPNDYVGWMEFLNKISYFNRANYKKYIPLWDRYFLDNIKYIPYGSIKKQPCNLLREIEDFLEIEQHDYAGVKEVVHKTKSVELPGWLRDKIKAELEPQYEFLAKRFGQGFLENAK